mmetsp:Transcript_18592/g.18683  ORF Transcript_18592/g.18683 Transcript_18592/m.18683 type:complete len:146 (-) Transcript_18592:62-499(-)
MNSIFFLTVFVMLGMSCDAFHVASNRNIGRLQMGLLDGFFGKKATASASHILVRTEKGRDAPTFLTELKAKINKTNNIPAAFADAAAKYSSCPSAQKGGSLGQFKQGQMVGPFDKVVFKEEIGIIHGPVNTPFGSHLILIESRSE